MRKGSWWIVIAITVVAIAVIVVWAGGASFWRSLKALHGQH